MKSKLSTSVASRSHLTIRAGVRRTKGTGQGWGLSVTDKQLAAYRKQEKKK